MTNTNITLLLPTRGRPDALDRSITSLLDNAEHPESIQWLLAFDNDDRESYQHFKDNVLKKIKDSGGTYSCMEFPPLGYGRLHEYLNALAKHGTGDWFVFWNDDAVMIDKGWDTVITSHTGTFCVQAFNTHNMHPYSIFPTIPRAWFDLLGYISPHSTQDGWVSQQAYLLDIYHRIPVDVLHDRFDLTGNNGDATYLDRHILEGKPMDPNDFHSIENLQLRQGDCAKLAIYMQQHGQSTEYFENVFRGTQEPWQRLLENDPNNQMKQFNNPHFGKSASSESIST